MDERLIPGEHPAGCRPADLRPRGRADGAFFLTDKRNANMVRVDWTNEAEALRYIEPMPPLWRAENLGMLGVCKPQAAQRLITAEMTAYAEDNYRGISYLFRASPRCVNIAQDLDHPERRKLWRLEKVKEGLWAVLCG